MSSIVTELTRIPWKEYLRSQLYKIIGILIIAILIIGVMFVSQEIDLSTATINDPSYVLAVLLSSLCFILVLIGFSKIVLFDMASEFGLRDEETNRIGYNARFFLFAALALSFCSCTYLLLDVFLYQENPLLKIKPTYLQLLPVLIMEWVLIALNRDIPNLTEKIGTGKEFYQTARNVYFVFFFLVIIAVSVIVFLSILTTLARKRVSSRFQKEEDVDEEEENKRLYKFLAWLCIPIIGLFLSSLLTTGVAPIIGLILLGMAIWWIYQLVKVIFLIIWRGFKITAFITSVNALLIIPLIIVLYLLPVIAWTIWDLFNTDVDVWATFVGNAVNILRIIQLDFVIITIIATFIVGFAEGFAVVAIFSALSRGAEVARTGQVIARSPPKIAVIMKYLIMFSAWLGLAWNSFRSILVMLLEQLQIQLPSPFPDLLQIPSVVYLIYDSVIIPLSQWLEVSWPTFKFIPFLLLPLFFIITAAFKFLSVTLVTPRVKERLSFFFLLVSTAFVLIITNILGDIYELREASEMVLYSDAPLLSWNLAGILSDIVGVFEYVESLAFYAGFVFGIIWVVRKVILSRKAPRVTYEPEEKITQPEVKPSTPIEDTPQEIEVETEPTEEISQNESTS
ncbi:MAG: hypothetical protein JSW11_09860 [Candidatus Heimdallarchaeota archaeon]|nr:MAG: hypothetical protein JSW11_09860 [Candidatus Heimdallarchaeota archaeon]